MKRYKKMTIGERAATTPKDQRHLIYDYVEKFIKKSPLNDVEKTELSKMLDDLAKIHNLVVTIENGRLVSALAEHKVLLTNNGIKCPN